MSATPEVRPDGRGDAVWDDFGLYQVADGVHRIPLALPDDGLRAVDVYVLGDVQRSLVTHIHREHYTQAVTLRREFGTRVGLGLGERAAGGPVGGAGRLVRPELACRGAGTHTDTS